MKNLIILFCLIIVSCNSNKNASHSNNNHSHNGQDSHLYEIENTLLNKNNYFGEYSLEDQNFGTKTKVTLTSDQRVMVTNSLPNHKTGAFPTKGNPNTISIQKKTYNFPLNPKYIGKVQWMREPGVALNGIKFEPQTAEVVVCETGENYRVEAIQDLIDLGLDFNYAHVQPTGAYHYHGAPTSAIENFATGKDLVHIGFAHDGFPMYYSKSGKYKTSFKLLEGTREGEDCTYENPIQSMDISVGGHHDGTYGSDFEYAEGYGDLDVCNGITIEGKYMYLVTNEFPYIGRCLMGEVEHEERHGPPLRQNGRDHVERLSATQLFEQMDTDKDGKLSKIESKGPLERDFSSTDSDANDFISLDELEKGIKNKGKSTRKE